MLEALWKMFLVPRALKAIYFESAIKGSYLLWRKKNLHKAAPPYPHHYRSRIGSDLKDVLSKTLMTLLLHAAPLRPPRQGDRRGKRAAARAGVILLPDQSDLRVWLHALETHRPWG